MPTRPPPVSARLLAGALITLAAAACGGSASSVDVPTQDPTPVPSAAPVQPTTATPTMPPPPTTPRPETTAVTFTSPAYRYLVTFPSGLLARDPVAVGEPWDGTARIDSSGSRTDHFYLQDGRLSFVYGAPTDLALEAYATAGQLQKATWHGCPAVPDEILEVDVGQTPALLYDFECGGLHILSAYAVRDGFGLVVNLMSPPGDPDADRALLDELLASMQWRS